MQEEGLSPRLRALAVRKARESFRLTREQKDRLSRPEAVVCCKKFAVIFENFFAITGKYYTIIKKHYARVLLAAGSGG